MTLGIDPSSSIPKRQISCNSLFAQSLRAIGTVVMGLFLTSNPIRAETSSQDLSQRTVVSRTEQVTTDVPPDEEIDSDDEELDAVNMAPSEAVSVSAGLFDPRYNYGFLFIAHHPVTKKDVILIGTNHDKVYAPIAMQNPFLPKIIRCCERVYTEAGNKFGLKTITDPDYDDVIGQIALKENKLLVRLDKRAVAQGEYAEILDEGENVVSEEERMYELLNDTNRFDQHLMTDIEMYYDDYDDLDKADLAWRDGNVEIETQERENIRQKFPKLYEKMFTNREKSWLADLSQDLRSDGNPICVAVGSNHLVGEDGFVAQLEQMGFVVTQSSVSECVQ